MTDKVCAECGYRLSEYLETGFLGCPECYNAFKEQILSDLYEMQGGNLYHTGKPPVVSVKDKMLLDEYKRLFEMKERLGIEGRFAEMSEVMEKLRDLDLILRERGIKK